MGGDGEGQADSGSDSCASESRIELGSKHKRTDDGSQRWSLMSPCSPCLLVHPHSSDHRPDRPLDGDGEGLGALAADEELRAVDEVEADAAVAAGVEDALAVAADADAPAAVVERAGDSGRPRACGPRDGRRSRR